MKEKESKSYKARKKTAQFFTPELLVRKILEESQIDLHGKTILEPSCGDGVFVEELIAHNTVYAVDKDKKKAKSMTEKYNQATIINKDFLTYHPDLKFDVVIGNPPFNLPTKQGYCDTTEGFISHAIDLAAENGYIIFILPNTVLRNKKYQKIRKKILENTQIYKILDTRGSDFLGADIETIALFLKKQKVKEQTYEYISKDNRRQVYLNRNIRDTIKINNDGILNQITNIVGQKKLQEVFTIYRGNASTQDSLRGKNINFYNDTLLAEGEEYCIGLQNIAYRLVANVIKASDKEISDTITILKPKSTLTYEQLCYMANYLNTPIANYMIHVNALNNSKLTIHIDKYYIEDICIPNIEQVEENQVKSLINNLQDKRNEREFAKVRNAYFYTTFAIKEELKEEIETMWQYPKYKRKEMKKGYGI